MYQPKQFTMTDQTQMREVIAAYPLATLIAGQGDQLQINHIPMLLRSAHGEDQFVLDCHVARANPVWQLLNEQPEVIAIFTGVQGYVSPNWYASKAVHGKVVPTWNYEAVHAYGHASICDDRQWLDGFLDRLTETHEASQARPWAVSDAPADYLDKMMGAIVGIEIRISRWDAKAKLSQNQAPDNRTSVVAGLRAAAETANGRSMADLIKKLD